VIALEGVEKSYGAKRALGPVTLDVPAGKRFAVVGTSGSGKSTLLRVILGLVRPDRGEVRVAGVVLRDDSRHEARRRIGYVVQEGGLFPHLTGERNVTLVARHLAWDEARIAKRVDELGAMVELDRATLARWPLEMSGGQRQRVGVMRALMLDPDVLLMDEPLGALDPVTRAKLQRELAALFTRLAKTVLVVTHDMAEAEALAEEAVVMREGRIVQRGTVEEMARAPADAFVAELLGARVRGSA
jgi:osmoprotectant transport system ATP-binding protein